ncbi:MAG: hypothetical protein OXG85_04860 [Chloroflexi bacterium]|nr:hypothetical protein [Chloroflexota bacterium]
MSEWEDITIERHDKQQSERPTADDVELSRQVLVLSELPPPRWAGICKAALLGSPGRLGRQAEVSGNALIIWGGPKIFDERDANHLKKMVAYTNEKYREILEPVDLSGFDAFGL